MSTIAPTGTDAELLRRARAELDAMPALTLPRLAARLGVTAAQIRDADQAGAVLGRIIATDASRQSATFTGHLLDGKTLQEIGDAAGLTRERVRQIIAAHGYDASAGTLVRRQGKIAALAAAAVPVREHLLANPGLTRDELAERTGADHAVLTVALRDPAVRRLLNHQGRGQDTGIPQAEIQRLLREAAAAVGADGLSRVAYDRWRDPAASVSGVRILQRHNSWRAACAAAGVKPGRQTRVRYTRRWDETSLRGWLRDYLREPQALGSYGDFERWLKDHPDAPSAQTIRNNLRLPWAELKSRMLAEIRDEKPVAASATV